MIKKYSQPDILSDVLNFLHLIPGFISFYLFIFIFLYSGFIFFHSGFATAATCPEPDIKKLCPAGEVLYLTSFSVPETSMISVIEEAFMREGRTRIIFRGLPEENGRIYSLKDLSDKLRPLVEEAIEKVRALKVPAPGKVRFAIDPRVFSKFNIKKVPAFIFCGKKEYRMIVGDISLDMAEYYLKKFSDRKIVYYGHTYEIREKDLRVVVLNFTQDFIKRKYSDFTHLAKEISEKARKRFFTGYKLPRATTHTRREISLADLILKTRDEIINEFESAFGIKKLPEEVRKVLLNVDRDKAEEMARTITSFEAGEEVIMADAEDPEQMKYVLKILNNLKQGKDQDKGSKNRAKKIVILLAGQMEQYYWKYYPYVFPLKKEHVKRWHITGLPARLFLNKKGIIVVEEGFKADD